MKKLFVAGATLFLLAVFAGRAGAVQIFQWTGQCDEGCTGSATATLTLSDIYVLGESLSSPFPNPYFVAFSYSSSSGSINVPGDGAFNIMFGSIPTALLGPATDLQIDINQAGLTYFCAPRGSGGNLSCPDVLGWTFRFLDTAAGIDIADSGRTDPGIWSQVQAVPEPGALALLGLALAGLALARRR